MYYDINEEEEEYTQHIIHIHQDRKDIQEVVKTRCYIHLLLSLYFHQFFQYHIKLLELIILAKKIKPKGILIRNHQLY